MISSSCNLFVKPSDKNKKAIARSFDEYLYQEDVKTLIPPGTSKQDSITILKNYIDQWLHQQVILHKAEKNLRDESKDVERQLKDYRNTLIRYAYEKELVAQQLDTNVTDAAVKEFYDANPQNFQLKDNIIKVVYLRLSKKSPKLDKVRLWYRSNLPSDRKLLEDYAHQYAINFFLDDNTWLLFDDLLKEIPIRTYDQQQFLQNNRDIEIADSTDIFLVSIKGFKIKDSVSPITFEEENIKAMIINQRKLELIRNMEKTTYEEALRKGNAEVLVK